MKKIIRKRLEKTASFLSIRPENTVYKKMPPQPNGTGFFSNLKFV